MTTSQLICTFCSRPQSAVAKLIAGPAVYICEGCVDLAAAVTVTNQPATNEFTTITAADDGACSFCTKSQGDEGGRGTVTAMATAKSARVCSECLTLCHEILAEELPSSTG